MSIGLRSLLSVLFARLARGASDLQMPAKELVDLPNPMERMLR